jgi:hypothetical protein
MQGRLRRDGALVVGYSPDSNDMSTEAEESPLLRAVIKQRLMKTLQAGEDLNLFTNPNPVYSHTPLNRDNMNPQSLKFL